MLNPELHTVFIHRGISWYLPFVLRQANSLTPQNDCTLIGSLNYCMWPSYVSIGSLSNRRITKFKEAYRHLSTNAVEFEMTCFLRWFYLLELMKQRGIHSVLYLDSDVMLLRPSKEIAKAYAGACGYAGFMIPAQSFDSMMWTASGHVSIWHREALEDFCNFCIAAYRDHNIYSRLEQKWQFVQETKTHGGVSDMTILYLFHWESNNIVTNLAKANEGRVFDHRFSCAHNLERNEYLTESGHKTIRINEDGTFFQRRDTGELVKVNALHFQGAAKYSIPRFYVGEHFVGQSLLKRYGKWKAKANA